MRPINNDVQFFAQCETCLTERFVLWGTILAGVLLAKISSRKVLAGLETSRKVWAGLETSVVSCGGSGPVGKG